MNKNRRPVAPPERCLTWLAAQGLASANVASLKKPRVGGRLRCLDLVAPSAPRIEVCLDEAALAPRLNIALQQRPFRAALRTVARLRAEPEHKRCDATGSNCDRAPLHDLGIGDLYQGGRSCEKGNYFYQTLARLENPLPLLVVHSIHQSAQTNVASAIAQMRPEIRVQCGHFRSGGGGGGRCSAGRGT